MNNPEKIFQKLKKETEELFRNKTDIEKLHILKNQCEVAISHFKKNIETREKMLDYFNSKIEEYTKSQP